MKVAFDALEAADPKDLDRAILAQTGMRKRPLVRLVWGTPPKKKLRGDGKYTLSI